MKGSSAGRVNRAGARALFPLLLLIVILSPSCALRQCMSDSCYQITDDEVRLCYYGGYPRGEFVSYTVEGADPGSFEWLEKSERGNCQRGHVYGRDRQRVFYRTRAIENAHRDTFEVLGNGYARDRAHVFFEENIVAAARADDFFAIANRKHLPWGAEKEHLFYKAEPLAVAVDTVSFELLAPPYYRDKNHVYYGKDLTPLPDADAATFVCPPYREVINYQYYAYDKNRAYYYENGRLRIIPNIDASTFVVLGRYYAKDNRRVFFKGSVVDGADAASFVMPQRHNHELGQDRLRLYRAGVAVE